MVEITVAWLEEQRACERHGRLFRELFGESAELTRENVVKAARAGMNIRWLAVKLLAGDAWDAYDVAEGLAFRVYVERGDPEAKVVAYREAQAEALCDTLGLP